MYAVIFKADVKKLNDDYSKLAEEMRSLALDKYHCVDFTCVTEGNKEITISYWNSLEDINEWKQDPEHLIAQDLGQRQFYNSYEVQIMELIREYKG
jgi:heme-degrading monooxygenase HmoA